MICDHVGAIGTTPSLQMELLREVTPAYLEHYRKQKTQNL
jgi:hypothetical protein